MTQAQTLPTSTLFKSEISASPSLIPHYEIMLH